MTYEKRTHLLSLGAIVFLGLTALSWFDGVHSAVAGYDFGTSLNPLDELRRSLYLWDERLYAGSPNILAIGTMPYFLIQYVLEYATGSLYRGEMVFFTMLFMLPGLTMYLFLRTVVKGDEKGGVAFFGSLFYMLNTFVVVKWNRGELITLFSYGTLPLFLTLVDKGIKGPLSTGFLVFYVLSLFFFPVTLGHSADFLIVTGIISAYAAWRMFSSFSVDAVKRASLLLLIAALVSAWWALPLLSSVAGGGGGITSFTTNELEMVNYYSRWASLLNIMKLWFSPMYDTSVEFGTQFYRPGTLLFPLFAFSVLFYRRDGLALFFSSMALAGLWLSKGTSAPLPGVYSWMYLHLPYFFIFRAPSRYFPLIYTLALSVLIGLSAARVTGTLKRLFPKRSFLVFLPGVLVVALIFFHSWPLFSRTTIFRAVEGDRLYPSVFVDIPPYYGKLNEWLKSREGYSRVHSFVTESYLNYDWGYSSTDIEPKLIEVPQTLKFRQELVFGSSGFHEFIDSVDRDYWAWDFGDTARTLGLLSVGYITVTDDVMRRYLPDSNYSEILKSELEGEPGIKKAATFGKATVYENAFKAPHIFAVPSAKVVFGGPSSLTTLSVTEYLESPALFFTKRLDRESLALPPKSVDGLLIADNNLWDIACENLTKDYGLKASEESSLYSNGETEYLLWAKRKKGGKTGDGLTEIHIDGRPVSYERSPGVRWESFGVYKGSPGGHDLSIKSSSIESFIAVPRKAWEAEIERTKAFLSSPGVPMEDILRVRQGERVPFYSSGDFVLSLTPLKGAVRENISAVREDYRIEPDRNGWIAADTQSLRVDGGIRFMPSGESMRVARKFKSGFDLEKYPYAEIRGESYPKGYFDVEMLVGIDTDGDGWADSEIRVAVEKGGRKPAPENLSNRLKEKFGYPGRPGYRVLWAAFEFKRSDGVREVKDATYTIKGIEFYYSIPSYMKSSPVTAPARVDGIKIKKTAAVKTGTHEIEVDGGIHEGNDAYLVRLTGKTLRVKNVEAPGLKWTKLDPTRYTVSVSGAKAPFWLIFNESYNEGWKAYVREASIDERIKKASLLAPPWNRNTGKEVGSHRMVNGFANAWWVEPRSGEFEILIEFKPQSTLNSGMMISGTALTVMLACAPFYFFNVLRPRRF